MKVLVIHPEDPSTDFLSRIYDGKDWTVIRGIGPKFGISKSLLRWMMSNSDLIIMMGHGCDKGLYDSSFNLVIGSDLVYLLREKTTIGIWCNADEFYKKYGMRGLCTGMIISEYMEANLYCVDVNYDEIENSNADFSRAFSENLNLLDLEGSVFNIQESYEIKNAVTRFNNEKIYYFE